MTKNINELNIYETTAKKAESDGSDLQIEKTPALEKLSSEIAGIKDAINHNESIDAENLLKIKSSLDDLMVDVCGEKMKISELKSISDLKMNMEIWKEMARGDYRNLRKLTFITEVMAEKIRSSTIAKNVILNLSGLRSITDNIAEIISKRSGSALQLNGLTSISDKTAESLSDFRGEELSLNGLENISDEAMKSISKFKGRFLNLKGLSSISADAAKYISKRDMTYGLSDEIREKIRQYLYNV